MYGDFLGLLRGLKPGNILLVQACLVVFVPYLLWRVMGLGKIFPLAVIQIFAGVLLGPSLFGAIEPDLQKALFGNTAGIGALATVAVCLFGFMAGADLDKELVTSSGRSVMSIGVAGMIVSWVLAAAAGYAIYYAVPASHGPVAPAASFAGAFGLAIAVSALPVLAAILRELDLVNRRLGAISLASAGIADTIMWLGLSLTIALAGVGGTISSNLVRAGLGIALTMGVISLIATPVLNRLLKQEAPERVVLTVAALTIFVTSAITSITELHPVLGAFMAGVFLPDRVRHMAAEKLDLPTTLVLMPFFFLNTGLRTTFTYNDPNVWILFGLATFFTLFGKIVGHGLAARASGENWPFSVGVGLLLQTKGLMGLIVISVFFEKEIVSQLTYSAIVVMCMVSTALPTPVMRFLFRLYGDRVKDGDAKPLAPALAPAFSPQPTPLPAAAVPGGGASGVALAAPGPADGGGRIAPASPA